MMLLGQIFQSMPAWQKLSAVALKPKLAYKILKYTKLVQAEYDIAEQQRVALIHKITATSDGQDARIEADTPQFEEYAKQLNGIMQTATALKPLDVDFEEIIDAVEAVNESLAVSDLALLESFFAESEAGSEADLVPEPDLT